MDIAGVSSFLPFVAASPRGLWSWAHTDRTDLSRVSLCGWEISRRLGGGKSHGCSAPLLPKAHTDSTRFNEKIICGNLCEFVAEKSSQKNIRVIREICGFRSRIQKSYKKFGIESKNLIIFSESIPNLLPLCPLWLTQIALLYNPTKIAHDSQYTLYHCPFSNSTCFILSLI